VTGDVGRDSQERALDEQNESGEENSERGGEDGRALPPFPPEQEQEWQAQRHHEALPRLDADVEAEEREQQAMRRKTELAERRQTRS
jgi:hypothetical protein